MFKLPIPTRLTDYLGEAVVWTVITRGQLMIKEGMNGSPEPGCINKGHARHVSPINVICHSE